MTILQQNSTHKAVKNPLYNTIEIWTKGLVIMNDEGTAPDLIIKPEYLYSIPASHSDDLFAIFERLDEDNRINVAEANAALIN